MSLEQPSTEEISDNIISSLEASLNQSIPLLPKSFLRVLSKTMGAVFITLYKYAGFIFLQLFVQTASDSDTEINGRVFKPLEQWGLLTGVGYKNPATAAEFTTQVTVNNQTGILPANSALLSAQNGITYLTLGPVTLNAATVSVDVIASADQNGGDGSGTQGNLEVGAVLTFANPIPQVNKDTEITALVVTGADEESTANYRKRILDRFQQRRQGGAPQDYLVWGEETEGIVNVYPYKSTNPGQVINYCEATVASSGNEDGIPTSAQLQAVLDNINYDEAGKATRRPISSLATAVAITRTGFDIEIIGVVVDNLAEVQEAIEQACEDYMWEREPYIYGLSLPPRVDRVSEQELSGRVSTILAAYEGYFEGVNIKLDGVVQNTYQLGDGEKAKAESVSFL